MTSGHHVAPTSLYIRIFLALMVGTIITVAVAFVDLGALNNVVMLAIACTKALLVVLYFMHVRWNTPADVGHRRRRFFLAAHHVLDDDDGLHDARVGAGHAPLSPGCPGKARKARRQWRAFRVFRPF